MAAGLSYGGAVLAQRINRAFETDSFQVRVATRHGLSHDATDYLEQFCIVTEAVARLEWGEQDLVAHSRGDPRMLAIAARLRQETTLSIRQIAERLDLGKPKGAKNRSAQTSQPSGSHQLGASTCALMNYGPNHLFLRSDPADAAKFVCKIV